MEREEKIIDTKINNAVSISIDPTGTQFVVSRENFEDEIIIYDIYNTR